MRNLTEIALKNASLVIYFVLVIAVGGIFSYVKLGRMEDPDFTIRQMIVTAYWPGASAEEIERQVTDKLEKKIQDIPGLDNVKSCTMAGRTYIYVSLDQTLPTESIHPTWRDVRNFCEDIRHELPDGVMGPYYNDRFDDVYGNIYALTGDGYTYEDMRAEAERIRRTLVQVPDVRKVSLIGEQTEKIYVEIKREKLETMGIDPASFIELLKAQNAMMPAGAIDTETDDVYLRVTGDFADVEAIKNLPLNVGGKVYRVGDVAAVERRFVEPSDPKMYYRGEPAVGIAVSMEPGGNILRLGDSLRKVVDEEVAPELPAGLVIHRVSDQPQVVEDSIDDFVSTLREAIIIVLFVSFLSLGLRTGMVVAVCIPLVLLATFLFMYIGGIDLHKVSLGSLIIALGLLVDDEIIAVEMMSVKLEEGMDRFGAACHAFRATAMPMLTGTLVTCAGFIPVAFSKGVAAEFCSALFPVISIALLISWIVAVMVAPLLGYHVIRPKVARNEAGEPVLYQGRFYDGFRRVLDWFLTHYRIALVGTLALFIVSAFLMRFVPNSFFPPSLRPEILVTMHLPAGASLRGMDDEVRRFSEFLETKSGLFTNYTSYVGTGAPRFVLTVDPHLPANNYAQTVLVAKGTDARRELSAAIEEELRERFPELRTTIRYVQTGPPAEYPVMFRVSGPDKEKAREIALDVSAKIAEDADAYEPHLDWNEKSKVLRVELDEAKLRSLGSSAYHVKRALYADITGIKASQLYIGDRTIDIEFRMPEADRDELSAVGELPVYLNAQAGYVPLNQIAKLSYRAENGVIWRRDLLPTYTVGAEVREGADGTSVSGRIYERMETLRESLPAGYAVEPAGSMEDSARSLSYLLVPVPFMVVVLMTLLMFQLRKIRLMIITLLTAPLGLIGVVFGMLLSGEAMGFVAQLGFLALSGMIIRNSVILIDQIEKHIAAGESPYEAIIDSAVLRFRPIMLTAAAAILGMVPLMTNPFWAPMAVTIASGLFIATILTLLVLPAMYAAVYRVRKA
ncbi:multidrug efflux RND transporter permease subunit MexK [Selenomonas sp. TAMA-11512]|uniref:efflux RND transporter permease subunit n=1 Tax=Selenomonas sp. TAMA-11512 TaxID=3095337 RepID=UPI00308C0D12|nr:multidrug efflux RND transporter permease subunit MexK [Selenomonas sp. TAMA-11512]